MMFDVAFSQLTPDEQQRLKSMASAMGFAVPAGAIGNQLVDAQGNAISGAPSVAKALDLMKGLEQGASVTSDGMLLYRDSPQSGLMGAERALEASTTGGLDITGKTVNMARDDISTASNDAQRILNDGSRRTESLALASRDLVGQDVADQQRRIINAALAANDMAQTGITQGRNDVLTQSALANLSAAYPVAPFVGAGQNAISKQAALSGALGSEAQQQAYSDFNSSPGQQYLIDQAEKSLTRNSAAIGGLGGGNVRTALQKQAIGMAAQDFDNYYNRLGQVSAQGLNAGQALSGTNAQIGMNTANQTGSLGGRGAEITTGIAQTGLGQLGSLGGHRVSSTNNLANTGLGQIGANYQLGAQMADQTGQSLGNTVMQGGNMAVNLLQGTGNNLANYRYDTGVNLANRLSAGSGQLATLNQNQGISQADLLGQYTGNLANLLSGTGGQLATSDQALATLLANIATGAGSQYSSLPGIPGVQAGNDHITSGGNLLSGIGAGAQALQGLM